MTLGRISYLLDICADEEMREVLRLAEERLLLERIGFTIVSKTATAPWIIGCSEGTFVGLTFGEAIRKAANSNENPSKS